MADIYLNFAHLAAHEVEGRDFRVVVKEGRSGIVIIAPHGGNIEMHTSDIARAIASADHALYLFEGSASQESRRLHVASEHFDEPRGVDIVEHSRLAVSVHGARGVADFVIVGGANLRAKALLLAALTPFGATVAGAVQLLGSSPHNICNRAKEAGVQLEISLGLRNKLAGPGQRLSPAPASTLMHEFAERARQALIAYDAPH